MACQTIELWTFITLVGAFLDLGITFLLLCASTLAFLTYKFLGLFGSHLPCPCDGLFGNPHGTKCVQRVLVDRPSEKILSVQASLKHKFPFDTILRDDINCHNNFTQGKRSGVHVEFEGEASCSSVRERGLDDMFKEESASKTERVACPDVLNSMDVKEEKSNLDMKGFVGQKVRHNLRYRHRGATPSWDFSPVSSNKPEMYSDDSEAPPTTNSLRRDLHCSRSLKEFDEKRPIEQSVLCSEEVGWTKESEKDRIKVLEEALEEERSARASLLLELEKERNAAGTAADEAMAMILRLQGEKASIEMEARQYKRMVEEKSAYDAEEMSILKEILVRREREKHCLEKEVETFRQMIFANECPDANLQDMETLVERSSSLYSRENPLFMLQQYAEFSSEDDKVKLADSSSFFRVMSIREQNHTHSYGKQLPVPEMGEGDESEDNMHRRTNALCQQISRDNNEIDQDFQENDIVATEENESTRKSGMWALNCSNTHELGSPEETIFHKVEDSKPTDKEAFVAFRTLDCSDENKITTPGDRNSIEKREEAGRGSKYDDDPTIDTEPSVHDVHVIKDVVEMPNKASVSTLNMPVRCDSPTLRCRELDRNRSTLYATSGLPPLGHQRRKVSFSDMRRNSMSAVDYERLQIDSEVGWLQKRLKIVQDGRQRLNLSVGCMGKENSLLQNLDDTGSHLREIWELTDHGKVECDGLSPLLSSEAMLKNRQWRSVSLDVNRSS